MCTQQLIVKTNKPRTAADLEMLKSWSRGCYRFDSSRLMCLVFSNVKINLYELAKFMMVYARVSKRQHIELIECMKLNQNMGVKGAHNHTMRNKNKNVEKNEYFEL
jgi:hypothetical protein